MVYFTFSLEFLFTGHYVKLEVEESKSTEKVQETFQIFETDLMTVKENVTTHGVETELTVTEIGKETEIQEILIGIEIVIGIGDLIETALIVFAVSVTTSTLKEIE